MTIKALVLDCDGVICESWGFSRRLAAECGITRETTNDFFLGPFQQCLVGKADLREALPPYLEHWGWKDSLEEFLSLWFIEDGRINNELLDYAVALRSAGTPLFMATNQEKYRSTYLRRVFAAKFDRIFTSSEMGAKKPDSAYFEAVTSALKMQPEDLLFWDDTAAYVEGAKQCGWNAEIYSSFAEFKKKTDAYLGSSKLPQTHEPSPEGEGGACK